MKIVHQTKNIFYMGIALLIISACAKDKWFEKTGTGPDIKIDAQYEDIKGINVGDKVTIPVTVTSSAGVKRLSYYFINKTSNGTVSETPVNADNTEYPSTLKEEITFTVKAAMLELVIVSFDKNLNSSEIHIKIDDIRGLPALTFKDGVAYQETVFENKKLKVQGKVTSEYDIAKITYKTIINGVVSGETALSFSDKKNTTFLAPVIVPKGLTDIIISASNIHNGLATDTFKIGSVVDDAVSISLAGISKTIPYLYEDSVNVFTGQVASGSDMNSLTYATKVNGTFGAEQPLSLGTPLDEFDFSISVNGVKGTEAIRISGKNTGGKQAEVEYKIEKFNRRLLRFTNIVLTSEIGAGKHNWFSAYKAPHVFDVTNAAANQAYIDFGTLVFNNAFRFVPPFIYTAGPAYQTQSAPYMVGFSKATYTMVTGNRRSVTPAAVDTLRWDSNLDNFINVNIKGPGPIGENYNVAATNRRISGDPVIGTGVVLGWGSWDLATSAVNNQAFGVVIVKAYTTTGAGKGTVTLDIVVPAEDQRAKFNSVSMFGYPSP